MAAQESSGSMKTINTKKRNILWWNEECQAAMKESHKTFNKAKRELTTLKNYELNFVE